jgi:hypothetical protein
MDVVSISKPETTVFLAFVEARLDVSNSPTHRSSDIRT